MAMTLRFRYRSYRGVTQTRIVDERYSVAQQGPIQKKTSGTGILHEVPKRGLLVIGLSQQHMLLL